MATKHINIWMRQLEMKRMEICELAGLMDFEEVQKEIGKEKSLEALARRCTNHFTRKVKRVLFGETDNMVWNESDNEIAKWCKRNKIYSPSHNLETLSRNYETKPCLKFLVPKL